MDTTYICRKVDGEEVHELTAAGAIAQAILVALDNGDCEPLFYIGEWYITPLSPHVSFTRANSQLRDYGHTITVAGRFLVQVRKVGSA